MSASTSVTNRSYQAAVKYQIKESKGGQCYSEPLSGIRLKKPVEVKKFLFKVKMMVLHASRGAALLKDVVQYEKSPTVPRPLKC